MQCPKCGHVQDENSVCSKCGIVFAKYEAYLKSVQSSQQPDGGHKTVRNGVPVIAVIVAVIITASSMYYVMKPAENKGSVARTDVGETVSDIPAENGTPFRGLDLVNQLGRNAPAANVIEQARNATVFVKTTWGTGSGFFATRSCSIITNKHVVKMSEKKLDRAQTNIKNWKYELETARKNLEQRKSDFYRTCKGCTQQQYDFYVGQYERELAEIESRLEKMDDAVTGVSTEDSYVIVLSDGTELEVYLDQASAGYDLALLKLYEKARCPVIPVSTRKNLNQGQKLFTIGSPIGIKHVVTSGIFSGYTQVGDVVMLQTDAPINPGNSGGPLIDEKGEIVGINTSIAKGAEGIGFAIPIGVALAEFGL